MDGAATEKARRASSVRVRGTASSGASDERRVRIGTWVCIRSLTYASDSAGNIIKLGRSQIPQLKNINTHICFGTPAWNPELCNG